MRENMDQKSSEYGHFLRSDFFLNPQILTVNLSKKSVSRKKVQVTQYGFDNNIWRNFFDKI